MTDEEARAVQYHERRKRQEWRKAEAAANAAARSAHVELAKLHDLRRLFPKLSVGDRN